MGTSISSHFPEIAAQNAGQVRTIGGLGILRWRRRFTLWFSQYHQAFLCHYAPPGLQRLF